MRQGERAGAFSPFTVSSNIGRLIACGTDYGMHGGAAPGDTRLELVLLPLGAKAGIYLQGVEGIDSEFAAVLDSLHAECMRRNCR